MMDFVDKNSVVISNKRYEELIRAETERNIIVGIIEAEKADYRMSEMVRIILKPYEVPVDLAEECVSDAQ